MGKLRLILGLLLVVLVLVIVWQVASCELANAALHDDLRDIAAQAGARIGLVPLSTDDQLRDAVIHAASKHDIRLEPSQIIVQRSGPAETPTIYLAADYKLNVSLPGYSFALHFNPSTAE
jgi:hypothetical protein